jgi:hypothetical protein
MIPIGQQSLTLRDVFWFGVWLLTRPLAWAVIGGIVWFVWFR